MRVGARLSRYNIYGHFGTSLFRAAHGGTGKSKFSEVYMEKIWSDLYDAAMKAMNPRMISRFVEAGFVGAAVESASGKIYAGVCVDGACTLGICAGRNAIFNMLTNGEDSIKRVVVVNWNRKVIPPCGACRELMTQLMPDGYRDIEIMLDFENNRVVTLGELTPEWRI